MSNDLMWILWSILGVVLIIAEVFTTGFVLLWFGLGALAAAIAGAVGINNLPIQFLIFATVSVALTAASRTIFASYFVRSEPAETLKSGMQALPGKVGTVVSSSRGPLHEGAVKVFGSTWTAFPADGEEPLEAGDRVTVDRIQGASIYVRRLTEGPGWRSETPTPEPKKLS